MAAPTPVSSLVHSSTLVTAGVYLFFRFFYIFSYLGVSVFLRYVRVLTSFLAGLMALYEVDLKKIVAISTLRQLGLIIFIISLGDLYLGFFHIVSHALFKALLFLRCGLIIMIKGGGQDLRFIGALRQQLKVVFLLILSSNLSLVGFPFLTGFFSKDLILEMRLLGELTYFLFFMLFFSCVFSFLYSYKIMLLVRINEGSMIRVSEFHLEESNFYMLFLLFFWAIRLGRIFSTIFFVGEVIPIIGSDKFIGLLVLILGLIFTFFSPLTLYYVRGVFLFEISYINWLVRNPFRGMLQPIRLFSLNDSLWLEFLRVKVNLQLFNVLSFKVMNFVFFIRVSLLLGIIIYLLLLFSLRKA